MRRFSIFLAIASLATSSLSVLAQEVPKPAEGDFTIHNFHFNDGETLPEMNLHYSTYGKPVKDASGRVTNAVMVLHGTTGSGHQFVTPQFAGVLFGPGELLDSSRYYIILPDAIGHGHSSKPSDGLRMKFPHYDYTDMVVAQHVLFTEGLKVNHLRLIMGTSMGCMHSFMWAEMYPDFMDAAMPLACLPVEIAGRNWMWRKMIMDSIKGDPSWENGNYTQPPKEGIEGALNLFLIMATSPLELQKEYPTKQQAADYVEQWWQKGLTRFEANDMLYAFDASRDYNPEPKLDQIKTYVMFVNSADDQINPPELGIAQREIKKVKNGKFVLLPITDQTRGHGTHSLPAIWKQYLEELLKQSLR